MVWPQWKTAKRPLRKFNTEPLHSPPVPSLGKRAKEGKVGTQEDTGTPIFTTLTSKNWKQPKRPLTDEFIYVYINIYKIYMCVCTAKGVVFKRFIKNTQQEKFCMNFSILHKK